MSIIETLTRLQFIEGKKYDTLKRREETLTTLREMSLQYGQILKDKEKKLHEFHKLETELKDFELHIDALKDKIKSTKDLLFSGKITSSKEILNLDHELDILKKQVIDLEDKELLVMETMELETKKILGMEEKVKNKLNQIKEQEDSIPVWKDEDEASIEALKLLLPPDLLAEFYQLFKTKGGVAVASLVEGLHCGGCGVAIPVKQQKIAQKGELVRCESCHRLLYRS